MWSYLSICCSWSLAEDSEEAAILLDRSLTASAAKASPFWAWNNYIGQVQRVIVLAFAITGILNDPKSMVTRSQK